ncbi:unnamed protein product [Rhizophagus irregularis]|nr:unnamed protein product [Rhizophagus irregularis]
MNIDENPKISKITLVDQITYLEKDFILVVKSKDLDQPRAFLEYNPETQTNCVMLTLVPKFSLNTTITELIFVVDRSGSMSGEPMKKAAEALELLLRSISEDSTSQDGPMKLDIPLDPVTLQGSIIHRLAARKLIQDLDDKTSFLHKNPKNVGKNIPDSLVKDNIIKLGKTFNLASKYTSFIGIDERTSEPNEVLIKPKQINVPQSVPASGSHLVFGGAIRHRQILHDDDDGNTLTTIKRTARKATGGTTTTARRSTRVKQTARKSTGGTTTTVGRIRITIF